MDEFALALPVDEAEHALTCELGRPGPQRHVQVGQLGEHEHRGSMIRESGR
jgi:hypothetical protein